MSKTLPLMSFCLVGMLVMTVAKGPRYKIGRQASPEEIRSRDISVAPDGAGLPAGHGTAVEGRALYMAKCSSCHGGRGEGTVDFPALVGGRGSLAGDRPVPTVGSYWPYATTLWDYIHRAMPYQNPGSLTSNHVYSLAASVYEQHHWTTRKSRSENVARNKDAESARLLG